MKLFLLKYYFLLALVTLACNISTSSAQETQKATPSEIRNRLQNAERLIFSHNFKPAIEEIKKAKKLEKTITDTTQTLQADIYYTTSGLNYIIHNYRNAASDIIKAITIFKKAEREIELGKAFNRYALILIKLKKYDDASEYLNLANDIFSDKKNEKNQAIVLSNLGFLSFKNGDYKPAINYFEAAIPLLNEHKIPYFEALSSLNEANAFIHLAIQTKEAHLEITKKNLKRAQQISNTNNYLDIASESVRLQSKIAFYEKDFNTAEILFKKYTKLNDLLTDIYIETAAIKPSSNRNTEHLNEVITAQQEELISKQKAIVFGKTTAGLAVTLMIILSLFALSLFKNNKLRAIANDLLRDKNVELILSKEKAEKASIAKAQFLSTITHELRTPLYAVTGLTHLLLESDPKAEQKEHLNSLKFSGEYLLSLINNILDLNKLEANKVEIDKTSFSLKKRINDVLIALNRTAEDRSNKLHLEFDESIPDRLMGDSLKLSQILINLIGNAVKFTQNGDIWVRVKKITQQANKVAVHIEIEDNGVGISKKKQKSIFETFTQGSLQINRKFGGSGLGLAIVKNLLELMNSKINLESELGRGSKFWFDITFSISEDAKNNENPNNIIYDIDYVALENVRILVVEDNKINQMITKKILEKNKMICSVSDNGTNAIKMVKENTYDAILMDIHMPGISGIVATQKIREFNKNIPILALTALTIEDNLDDFYKAGFNEIIPKPFKPEEFFEKIYRALKNKQKRYK